MKETNNIIVVLLLIFSMYSCMEKSGIYRQLVEVDSLLLKDQPESARMMLGNIDKSSLASDKDKAYYYMLLSHTMYWLYEPITSDSLINFSVEHYKREKDDYKLARSLYYKGMVLSDIGHVNEAVLAVKKAETIAEKNHFYDLCVKIYVNLASMNMNVGNYNKALDYTVKAIKLSRKCNNKRMLGESYNKLSILYNHTQKHDSALIYAKKSLAYIRYTNKRSRANILNNASICFANNGETANAEKYALLSLKEFPLPYTHFVLGELYMEQDCEDKAMDSWNIALKTGDLETKINVLDFMAEYKKQKGDYKDASMLLDSMRCYKDSLRQKQHTEEMLLTQDKVDKENVEQQSPVIFYSICLSVFIFVVLTVIVLYKSLVKKSKMLAHTLKQIDDYSKQTNKHIKELEKDRKEANNEIIVQKRQLETIRTQRAEIIGRGKNLYEQIESGKTAADWHNSDFEAFVEYYRYKDYSTVKGIESEYRRLTSYNLFHLLLPFMGIDENDIPRIVNRTPNAIRAMHYRISKLKNLP